MTQPSPWSTQPGDDPFAAAREALARRIAAEQTRGPSPIPGGALDEVLAEVADLRPLPQVAQRILALDDALQQQPSGPLGPRIVGDDDAAVRVIAPRRAAAQ